MKRVFFTGLLVALMTTVAFAGLSFAGDVALKEFGHEYNAIIKTQSSPKSVAVKWSPSDFKGYPIWLYVRMPDGPVHTLKNSPSSINGLKPNQEYRVKISFKAKEGKKHYLDSLKRPVVVSQHNANFLLKQVP